MHGESARLSLAALSGRVVELGAGNGLNLTEAATRAVGFDIEHCRRFPFKGGPVTSPTSSAPPGGSEVGAGAGDLSPRGRDHREARPALVDGCASPALRMAFARRRPARKPQCQTATMVVTSSTIATATILTIKVG
jgi:hypothetical protein